MNTLQILELESVIENNEMLLDFHDLTKAEEKACKAEIKKCQEALKALEEPQEEPQEAFNPDDVTMTFRQMKRHKEFTFYYKGEQFAQRKSKRDGQEAYCFGYRPETNVCYLISVGKLKTCDGEERSWNKYYGKNNMQNKAYTKIIKY